MYPDYQYYENGPGQYGYGNYPLELRNDDNWGSAWYLLLTYCMSGLFWIFGATILVPGMLTYTVIEAVDGGKAFWLMLLGDYRGRYLSFNDWMTFTVRRTVVQHITNLVGLIFGLSIPGLSAIIMPVLGLFSLWNLLDF